MTIVVRSPGDDARHGRRSDLAELVDTTAVLAQRQDRRRDRDRKTDNTASQPW